MGEEIITNILNSINVNSLRDCIKFTIERKVHQFTFLDENCQMPYRPKNKHRLQRGHILTMEVGVQSGYVANGSGPPAPTGILSPAGDVRRASTERSPARHGLHVAFKDKGEIKEKREKFLTAKYGQHQMSLIRKRLAVEMWLYEELKKLYDINKIENSKKEEVEVDIDELLDMDNDDQRRRHLQNLLVDAKSQNDVKKFINDLLEKAKTL